MKKILILTDIGFSQRDYNRFGVEILKKNFEVNILDFTEWFSPEYWKAYTEKTYQCEGYKKISDIESFEKIIYEKNVNHAIDYISTLKYRNQIRNFLRSRNIPITKERLAPFLESRRNIVETLYKFLFIILKPLEFLEKLKTIFKKKNNNLKDNFSYDYVISAGEACLTHSWSKKAKKIIKAHCFDFDIFLKNNSNNIDLKNYAVFLDQNIPFHSGFKFRKMRNWVTKDKYYFALNNFFKDFEEKTNLKVVIAAHPRSRYDLHPECLYGRKYSLNKTAELVKNSKIVLLHGTTSLSFAILYEKPTIFLTSNEIKRNADISINSYARSMNSFLFNIDEKNNYNNVLKNNKIFFFDKTKYEDYKKKFIKFPGTPDKNLWQIFLDNIDK